MIVKNFPWVVLGASIISWIEPGLFSWFHGVLITLALGGIMVGMGLHLQWKDFLVVKESPWSVFLGVFLQYTIMPLAGAWIALVLDLKPPFYAGLVLVACCPGGTASNVIVYLAKANLALSVVLTSLSTIFAIFMTPLLTSFYLGQIVHVNKLGMVFSTFQVILIPIVIGLILNKYFPKSASIGRKYSGGMSVFLIAMIVASIIGSSKKEILESGWQLLLACVILHATGFILGYALTTFINGRDPILAKTISIEVGMQNSGLGVVLARQNFIQPETAIPSAISSLTHSLLGSLLVWFWRRFLHFPIDDRTGD
jgi:BASS family bile acid:Na+ symporter